MKSSLGACLLTAILGCVLAFSAHPRLALSQEQPSPGSSTSAEAKPPARQSYLLEISNGELKSRGKGLSPTLQNVVEVLRELYPDVNIVISPCLAETLVGDLKMRASSLPEALEAIRVAASDSFVWRHGAPGGGVDPTTGLPLNQKELLCVLEPTGGTPIQAGPDRTIEVFNLAGYLDQLGQRKEREDDLRRIQEIILDTVGMVRKGDLRREDVPEFRFHPGANLLIVVGPRDAVEVARKVVNALPGQATSGYGTGLPPNVPDYGTRPDYREPRPAAAPSQNTRREPRAAGEAPKAEPSRF